VSVQNEYNLLQRKAEQSVLPECERRGLAFLPYFPLASGLLTGKYRRARPLPKGTRLDAVGRFGNLLEQRNLDIVESLIQFATARGHSLLELAISWLASRPTVASVISGATSPAQVRTNAGAAGWKLSDSELSEIDSIVGRPQQQAA
jgi:aryl-alcohol dehydrogenase-like predicted oxidoreductase